LAHFPARLINEVSRADELAEGRCARSVDHAGLEVEEHRAWYVFAARGLVVKHVNVAELRVVAAAVLAVAADAVLVAQHLLKLGFYLATALARMYVHNLSRKSTLGAIFFSTQKSGSAFELQPAKRHPPQKTEAPSPRPECTTRGTITAAARLIKNGTTDVCAENFEATGKCVPADGPVVINADTTARWPATTERNTAPPSKSALIS
jgi:hypothetical protein